MSAHWVHSLFLITTCSIKVYQLTWKKSTRPILTLIFLFLMSLDDSHEIFLILNDKSMSSKNKVFCILAIIKAEVCEKYEILQPEKVQQQILSEILLPVWKKRKQESQCWLD